MWESGFLGFKLDYARVILTDIGDCISSDAFAAGGYLWRVICYPRGLKCEGNNGEYLGIYLQLVSKSKNVKAIFDVFMMGIDGKPSTLSQRCMKVFPPEELKYSCWGLPQLVKRIDLAHYLINGSFTIACGVIVVRDDPIPVPPSDLGIHLGHLLDPLWEQMYATMPSITLHDIEPEAFKIMLRFMYTDALPGDDELGDCTVEMMQHLIAAADRYALDRLKLMCAAKLWEIVTVDTVASVLISAETYNIPKLRSKCIDFFAVEKNFKKAAFTDGFAMLLQKFPALVAELRGRVGI
ncbi:hypothetical protein EJB05_48159, partial [Eragrostis curvula]